MDNNCLLLLLSWLVAFCLSTCCAKSKLNESLGMSGGGGGGRHLVFPPPTSVTPTKIQIIIGLGIPMEVDVSTIMGYVVKLNYNLPYNATAFTQPYLRNTRSANKRPGKGSDPPSGTTSRWQIYKIVESTMRALGSGRSCLLRVICEAQQRPFDEAQGLLNQLLHVFLVPSATDESYDDTADQEYHAAAAAGRNWPDGHCHKLFAECNGSPLDYFTYSH